MNTWAFIALAFAGGAGLVAVVAYLVTGSSRRTQRRLETLGSDPNAAKPAKGEADHFPTLTALLKGRGHLGAMQNRLDRAGVLWRPSELMAACLATAVVLAVAGWLVLGPLGAAAGILLAVLVPWITLTVREQQRLRAFERQLPDALMLMASSLRSGYGILRAMQAVRNEMKPPISIEFGKMLDETNVGVPTAAALVHLGQRVPLPDLDIAITAILIQLETGGNLAEIMEIVASTVRERQRIRAEVNTLTAEGRMSGIILFLLPLAMAGILLTLNPAYMSSLFATGLGRLLIGVALGLQFLGGVVIYRMLQLDF